MVRLWSAPLVVVGGRDWGWDLDGEGEVVGLEVGFWVERGVRWFFCGGGGGFGGGGE